MGFTVNILFLGAAPVSDLNAFISQLVDVYHSAWSKKSCGFSVEPTTNGLTVKQKEQRESFQVQFVNEPFVGDYKDDRAYQEWISKYETIVMVCNAADYSSNSFPILQVRNAMAVAQRRNDSILFLMGVEEVMENVGEYGSNAQKAVALYSALTEAPYDSATCLRGPSFLSPLNGEESRQYQHPKTGHCFSMPVNVICHLECASGYELLLLDILDRLAEKQKMQLINNHNSFLTNKHIDMCHSKQNIRVAVVGSTSHGKTYTLQDAFECMNVLTPKQPSFPNGKFSSFARFTADVAAQEGGILQRTRAYACRHRDQYGASVGGKSILFLDIPGEVLDNDICTACVELYEALRDVGASICVTSWRHRETLEEVVKTVSFAGWNRKSENPRRQDRLPRAPAYDDNIEDTIAHLSEFCDPSPNYANVREMSFVKKRYAKLKKQLVTGKFFIENFYEYDADSCFHFLKTFCQQHPDAVRIPPSRFDEVAKKFYFYYFLFQATDIVFIENVNRIDDGATFIDVANPIMGQIMDLNPDVTTYLGLKGVDVFFLKNQSLRAMYDAINVGDADKSNIIYSAAAMAICKKLYPGMNTNINDTAPQREQQNVQGMQLPAVDITREIMGRIQVKINIFTQINGGGIIEGYQIPRHTYFLSTPIKRNYEVVDFDDVPISTERCHFGTKQLLEDILMHRGVPLRQAYSAVGGFLNAVRGDDRN